MDKKAYLINIGDIYGDGGYREVVFLSIESARKELLRLVSNENQAHERWNRESVTNYKPYIEQTQDRWRSNNGCMSIEEFDLID